MLTNRIALNVYKTTILPIIDYGDIFYNAAPKSLLNKLQILQNKAIRIIAKLPGRSKTDIHHRIYDILPLSERRKLHTIQLGYWLSEDPNNLDLRVLSTRSHTSSAKLLIQRRMKTNKCNNNFIQLAVKYWNNLPPEIRNLRNNKKILKYLMSIANYNPS